MNNRNIVIIAILTIAGGSYYWYRRQQMQAAAAQPTDQNYTTSADLPIGQPSGEGSPIQSSSTVYSQRGQTMPLPYNT